MQLQSKANNLRICNIFRYTAYVIYTVSLYFALIAHHGSLLQSARRHTLNTIPGALLNAARAFISCLNRWMSTKEPGRVADVSTCSIVMRPDWNTTWLCFTARIAGGYACAYTRRNMFLGIIFFPPSHKVHPRYMYIDTYLPIYLPYLPIVRISVSLKYLAANIESARFEVISAKIFREPRNFFAKPTFFSIYNTCVIHERLNI